MLWNEATFRLIPKTAELLRLFVVGVLAAGVTELGELEAAGGRLLVLGGRVIPVFALRALQCNDFTHLFILTDFAEISSYTRKTRSILCSPESAERSPDLTL